MALATRVTGGIVAMTAHPAKISVTADPCAPRHAQRDEDPKR